MYIKRLGVITLIVRVNDNSTHRSTHSDQEYPYLIACRLYSVIIVGLAPVKAVYHKQKTTTINNYSFENNKLVYRQFKQW